MPGRIDTRPLKMQLRVPKGEAAIWDAMCALQEVQKSWTLADVHKRCEHMATIRQYLRRLITADLAECVDEGTPGAQPPEAKSYRLKATPLDAPRFDAKGKLLGERAADTLWRTVKMLKVFTPEAAVQAMAGSSDQPAPLKQSTVERLCREWSRVGVLERIGKKNPPHYRLARNIGRHAPRILRAHIVYDPNAKAVLGEAEAEEVRS